MSRTGWKATERAAAKLIGGRRYPASTGGAIDCESDGYVVQVKERRTLSLAQLEALALEIARVGAAQPVPKAGLLIVKRSAGRGVCTPTLIVLTAETFRFLNGRLPTDPTED